ncbi:MAG: Asp23/Gls24 family envelope stress response protein [Syntrophaceticus sp.]
MSESHRTDFGRIEITPEALASIAGAAAVRCFGIVGMVPRGLRQGVSEILGEDSLSRGVEIKQDESGVKIDLWVVMCYGVNIAEVAHNVMETVSYEIEKMTGLRILEVNVNVMGVRVFK